MTSKNGWTDGRCHASGCTIYADRVALGMTFCEGQREGTRIIHDPMPANVPNDDESMGFGKAGRLALLWAAAPELAEAVANLLTSIDAGDSEIRWVRGEAAGETGNLDAMRAALAKALGEAR